MTTSEILLKLVFIKLFVQALSKLGASFSLADQAAAG